MPKEAKWDLAPVAARREAAQLVSSRSERVVTPGRRIIQRLFILFIFMVMLFIGE